jgi:hypothetical protein
LTATFLSDRFARFSARIGSHLARVCSHRRSGLLASGSLRLACCSDGSVDLQRFVRFVSARSYFQIFLKIKWNKWNYGENWSEMKVPLT